MTRIAIIYHSQYGHTRNQARAVHQGVASVAGVEAVLLTTQEASDRLDELDRMDGIILGCPTYMGTVTAEMKRFCESASRKWIKQSWKNKIAGAFTNSASFSGDKLNTLTTLVINAMQHGMIYVGTATLPAANEPESMATIEGPGPQAHNRVGSFIGPMASSFDVQLPEGPSQGDIETAYAYGRRVAQITSQFVKGAS